MNSSWPPSVFLLPYSKDICILVGAALLRTKGLRSLPSPYLLGDARNVVGLLTRSYGESLPALLLTALPPVKERSTGMLTRRH